MSELLTVDDLKTAVHAALKAWQEMDGTPKNWLEPLILVQERRVQMATAEPVVWRLATNEVLHDSLETLALTDKASADILTWRYLGGEKVTVVASRLGLDRHSFLRRQRKAIMALTQVILEKEKVARQAKAHQLEAQLASPSYSTLFGAAERLSQLEALLLPPEPPWVVAITGIGGLGKTSLAQAALRQLIPRFRYERVAWLSVNMPTEGDHSLPANLTVAALMSSLAPLVCPYLPPQATAAEQQQQVRQMLQTFPHLIVIDNLEAETPPELLRMLHDLAQPSKFLLTSRIRPSSSVGIYNFPLPELNLADTLQLIRDQAERTGLSDLAQLPDEVLQPVYEQVGGNPLALKLIVGLTQDLSLPQILEELQRVQVREIAGMYQQIYEKAWQSLSPEGKVLLTVMPLAADTGIVQAHMQEISGLEEKQLLRAIQELSRRSLLEVRGTAVEHRYIIHSLTRTFLASDIIHWPPDSVNHHQ